MGAPLTDGKVTGAGHEVRGGGLGGRLACLVVLLLAFGLSLMPLPREVALAVEPIVVKPEQEKLDVTALGPTVEAAQSLAYQAVRRIDWPEGFYRRDIGWRAIAQEQAQRGA